MNLRVAASPRSVLEDRLSVRQLTDAYLLSLAHHRKGVLATFDRGVRTLAGQKFAGAVEIVSTR